MRIRPDGLLYDVEHDLLDTAKSVVESPGSTDVGVTRRPNPASCTGGEGRIITGSAYSIGTATVSLATNDVVMTSYLS